MPGDDLPVEVSRSVELFLTAVDELAPGLVTGLYLVGSVALGDFQPSGAGRGPLSTASDIDFVAVTDRRVERESREMKRWPRHTPAPWRAFLGHTSMVRCSPGPTSPPGPDGCPDVPCAQQSRFTPAGRSGINPVTFCELARHGIAVRGPQPADLDLSADQDALRAFTVDNLRTYWRPWWRQKKQPHPLALAIGLSAWFPVWAVLGVSRLHHVLATGTLTSKSGAGRYAQDVFEPRWQRIIAESLWLRTDGAEGGRGYRNPLARRRETLAFLDTTIEAALALPATS